MTKEKTIQELEQYIADECRAVNIDAIYAEMLDECYSLESVGGPFASMQASRVLAEMDPVAYRCGKIDYIYSQDIAEIYGEKYNHADVRAAVDNFQERIESEIADVEQQIEDINTEAHTAGTDAVTIDEDKVLTDLREKLAIVNAYHY